MSIYDREQTRMMDALEESWIAYNKMIELAVKLNMIDRDTALETLKNMLIRNIDALNRTDGTSRRRHRL